MPGLVFPALALLLPPIAIYAPKGMVPLAVIAALLLLMDDRVRSAIRLSPVPVAVFALLPLILWGAVTIGWTPGPLHALRVWASTVVLIAVGWVLAVGATRIEADAQLRVVKAAAIGGIVFVGIMLMENISNGLLIEILKRHKGKGVNDFTAYLNPGNAILAVSGLAFATAIGRALGRVAGWIMTALIILVVAVGTSTASVVAIVVAVVLGGITALRRHTATKALAIALAVWQLSAPVVVSGMAQWGLFQKPPFVESVSVQHRLAIWQFAIDRIAENPIMGWGLDSSRAIPGGREHVFGEYGEMLPLHPHSAALQVWLELGAIGAIAAAVLFASAPLMLRIVGKSYHRSGLLVGSFGAFLILGQLSYGFWQGWWIATGAVVIALTLAVAPPPDTEPPPR